MSKVTLKTIADLADTSPATVSRYLSKQGYVSETTRSRIEDAMQQIGYQPKKQRYISVDSTQKMVMVISSNVTSQIYIDYFQGLNYYLTEKGYVCLQVCSNLNSQKEVEYLKFAEENQFGAIVMLNVAETPELIRQLAKTTRPVVFVNRYLRSADVDSITVDNYRGGYTATRYLLDAGHHKIAHLAGITTSVVCQDRLLGFQDAMEDAGVPLRSDNIFHGDLTEESGERFAEEIARKPHKFTAVFVGNDYMAIGLLNGLYQRGISVPKDISIVNFDSTPIVKHARVKLTSVGFSSIEMGRAAGEIVYQRMSAQENQPRKVIYPATIDEGDSVRTLSPK